MNIVSSINIEKQILDIKIDASKKFELYQIFSFMESLILAQDERWRRA